MIRVVRQQFHLLLNHSSIRFFVLFVFFVVHNYLLCGLAPLRATVLAFESISSRSSASSALESCPPSTICATSRPADPSKIPSTSLPTMERAAAFCVTAAAHSAPRPDRLRRTSS